VAAALCKAGAWSQAFDSTSVISPAGNGGNAQKQLPEKRTNQMLFLEKLDPGIVTLIIVGVAALMFLLSRLVARRNKELKTYNEMLTQKMTAYSEFAKACRVAHDTDQLSAYKEVNEKAQAVLELIGDTAKDAMMDIIIMTEKKSGRPNKTEFFKKCEECMKVLNKELYEKPPKFR
jgi:hypothetical protein